MITVMAIAVIGTALVSAFVASLVKNYLARKDSAAIQSVAVLPFENKNSDADTDYLSDGLTESLIFRLSQLPGLKVSPATSVMRYKDNDTDVTKIAQELSVEAIMTGRVVKRGDNLNITVELIDVRNNKSLWGEQYERKMSDLLATQREIATTITEKLKLRLSGESEQKLVKKYTDSNEAYERYLKGRYYWNKRDEENISKAIVEFKAAVGRDPNFALAFSGLADCYGILPYFSSAAADEVLPVAKAYASRALEIDDSLGEAHTSLGQVHAMLWNWSDAEREYKRAIDLNPNYATAHQWYGNTLFALGRFDDALARTNRAHHLEPLSLIINMNIAEAYLAKGDLSAAAEQCRKTIDLDPNWYFVRQLCGLVHLKQGRNAEATIEAEKSVGMSNRQSYPLGVLGQVYAQTGKRTEALSVLDELKEKFTRGQAKGYDIARVYVGIGDRDQAFAWLERDVQSRSATLPTELPLVSLDFLRDDPRYKDLRKRMNMLE